MINEHNLPELEVIVYGNLCFGMATFLNRSRARLMAKLSKLRHNTSLNISTKSIHRSNSTTLQDLHRTTEHGSRDCILDITGSSRNSCSTQEAGESILRHPEQDQSSSTSADEHRRSLDFGSQDCLLSTSRTKRIKKSNNSTTCSENMAQFKDSIVKNSTKMKDFHLANVSQNNENKAESKDTVQIKPYVQSLIKPNDKFSDKCDENSKSITDSANMNDNISELNASKRLRPGFSAPNLVGRLSHANSLCSVAENSVLDEFSNHRPLDMRQQRRNSVQPKHSTPKQTRAFVVSKESALSTSKKSTVYQCKTSDFEVSISCLSEVARSDITTPDVCNRSMASIANSSYSSQQRREMAKRIARMKRRLNDRVDMQTLAVV